MNRHVCSFDDDIQGLALPEHGTKMPKFPSQSILPEEKKRRRWFADLMWRTFPGASIREKAERAAPVLNLSVRQCENLMKMEHDTKLGPILAVLALAGAENIFDIIGGSKK